MYPIQLPRLLCLPRDAHVVPCHAEILCQDPGGEQMVCARAWAMQLWVVINLKGRKGQFGGAPSKAKVPYRHGQV